MHLHILLHHTDADHGGKVFKVCSHLSITGNRCSVATLTLSTCCTRLTPMSRPQPLPSQVQELAEMAVRQTQTLSTQVGGNAGLVSPLPRTTSLRPTESMHIHSPLMGGSPPGGSSPRGGSPTSAAGSSFGRNMPVARSTSRTLVLPSNLPMLCETAASGDIGVTHVVPNLGQLAMLLGRQSMRTGRQSGEWSDAAPH